MKIGKTHKTSAEELLKVVQEKYNKSFTIEYFIEALDDTYQNVLTVSDDNDYLFNVRHYPEDVALEKVWDDYALEIIDEKFLAYLKEDERFADLELNVNVTLIDGDPLTYELVTEKEIEYFLQQYDLLKLIFVVKVDKNEASLFEMKDTLYALYETMISFNPKYIDFQVVRTDSKDERLLRSISNINAYYENSWKEFDKSAEFIATSDKNVLSAEELLQYYTGE